MIGETTLFDLGQAVPIDCQPRTTRAPGTLIQRAVRNQREMAVTTLDDRIARTHPVRAIVAIVEGLDVGVLDGAIESDKTRGGRPAIDPRILLSLWIWGTSQGESSAAEIASRVTTDDVYRWICGLVDVGERSLSSFRANGEAIFMSLIEQVLAVLMNEGLIDLHRVAQDGTRTRASAGADSFRRAPTLEVMVEEARKHLKTVLAEPYDPERSKVAGAAAERGAKDRLARIERALARAKALSETKSEEDLADKTTAPRASTSDPEATRMKMPDGGTRPAFNIQFATAADGTGAIVGVAATNLGNDFGELTPMLDQIEARTGQRPTEVLVDGGYVKQADVEAAEKSGTAVYAPVPKKKADPNGRSVRERSPEVTVFYERIESEEGKAVYKKRGEVAELANAHAKSRYGLSLLMRGLKGALTTALLVALANDVNVLVRERARAIASADASAEARAPASTHDA